MMISPLLGLATGRLDCSMIRFEVWGPPPAGLPGGQAEASLQPPSGCLPLIGLSWTLVIFTIWMALRSPALEVKGHHSAGEFDFATAACGKSVTSGFWAALIDRGAPSARLLMVVIRSNRRVLMGFGKSLRLRRLLRGVPRPV
jgi:hypothetical protein